MRRKSNFKKNGFYMAVLGVICVAGFMAFEQERLADNDASQIKLAQEGHREKDSMTGEDEKKVDDGTSSVFGNLGNDSNVNDEAENDLSESDKNDTVINDDDTQDKTDTDKNSEHNEDSAGEGDVAIDNDEDDKDTSPQNEEKNVAEKTESDSEECQVSAGAYSFNQEQGISWPLEGEVLLKYSVDSPVYYETMGSFMINEGIMIQAKEGDAVRCGCDGVVTKIYEDDRFGSMMDIAVGDDYTITYGQLKNYSVNVGDAVKAGQEIAQVAVPTSFFAKEGANVYMKVMEKNESVDPLLLLE